MRATFDRFTFDSEQRTLLDGAQAVHVGPKAFQLLDILIGQAPRALGKRELCEQIWPDTVTNESGLAGLVNELRDALGDTARKPRFIRTVHGFGYSFCGELLSGARRAEAMVVFRGRELPLYGGLNVLGRDPSADVQIDDVTVSRRHASITIAADVMLEDLESKNGTFIDGQRVKAAVPLPDGQTFVLGDASVTFRRSPGGSTVTVSPRARS
ncbi:MAG TPA: FHA domain-containing protein [Thermoanaerobaculia bacterium]|nr:FHA domain-containing protein [Thermoanaerobaculia bacterium]